MLYKECSCDQKHRPYKTVTYLSRPRLIEGAYHTTGARIVKTIPTKKAAPAALSTCLAHSLRRLSTPGLLTTQRRVFSAST